MKYEFIGWCKQDNHDKVWGAIKLRPVTQFEMDVVIFWGRRGKKLQTKIIRTSMWSLETMINSKIDKGYTPINHSKLDEVYPEFEKDLSKTAMWAMLKV